MLEGFNLLNTNTLLLGAIAALLLIILLVNVKRNRAVALANETAVRLANNNTLLELLSIISNATSTEASAEEYIEFSLEKVCEYMGWPIGHVYKLDEATQQLSPMALWKLSDPEQWQPFTQATMALSFKKDRCLICHEMASGKVVWADNISDDPEFKRRDVARELDLKTGCILPIVINGHVAYVLEFYTEEAVAKSPSVVETLTQIASHISRAVSKRQLEQKLQDTARRFEAIFNQTFQFIGVLSPEGLLLEANQSSLKASGVDPADVINKPFWQGPWWAHSVELQAKLRRSIQQAAQGKFVRFEANHPTPSGELLTVDFSLKPVLDDDGQVVLIIPEGRDITYTKEVEKSLISAREEALSASKAKGQFLANMTHEIRTPLNAIIGFTQLLLDKDLAPDVYDDVKVLESSGKTLLTLVNDILDLSKIESGKMTLEMVPFNLSHALTELASLFEYQGSDSLAFNLDLSGVETERLVGDVGRIRQVLTNFLSNAFKFTKQGSITLKASSTLPNEGISRVIIDVIDTGKGIDEGKLETIFGEFLQEDVSTTRQYGGTGLGLSISKQLADLMDGRIRVKSGVGQGSTFTFSIPLAIDLTVEEPGKDDLSNPTVDYENLQVLLVEDNILNQKVAQRLLEKFGATVTIASNGLEALAVEDYHAYQIIFMDCQMPEMDGFTTTRALRHQGVKTPIIALTANTTYEEREKCMMAGMDAFMTKPIQQNELVAMINHWVQPEAVTLQRDRSSSSG